MPAAAFTFRSTDMTHAVNWFEIPAQDLDRAIRFYENVLGITLRRETFLDVPQGIFPGPEEAVRGAIVRDGRRRPSADGALVYLDASPSLDACLARVASAGGAVVLPRTDIGAPGFIALVRDTEGNVVGLHTHRGG